MPLNKLWLEPLLFFFNVEHKNKMIGGVSGVSVGHVTRKMWGLIPVLNCSQLLSLCPSQCKPSRIIRTRTPQARLDAPRSTMSGKNRGESAVPRRETAWASVPGELDSNSYEVLRYLSKGESVALVKRVDVFAGMKRGVEFGQCMTMCVFKSDKLNVMMTDTAAAWTEVKHATINHRPSL